MNRSSLMWEIFLKEYVRFKNKKDELWGFITKDGRHCIPPTFQHAYSFSEGVAGVKVNDKWGFIVME